MNEYKCRQSVLIIAFWIANLVCWEVNHSRSAINKAVRHWVLQNQVYFSCITQKNQSTAALSCSSSTWWGKNHLKLTWEVKKTCVREREDEREGNPAETQSLFQFPEQPVTSIFSCRSADIGHQSHVHIHRCTNAFLSSVPMFILFSAPPFLATLLHKHLWFQRYRKHRNMKRREFRERKGQKIKKNKWREEEELARYLDGPKIANCWGPSDLQSHGHGENGDTSVEERGWVEEMETAINKWGDWKGKNSRHCFGLFMEVSTVQSNL